jgi:hypothetical protein
MGDQAGGNTRFRGPGSLWKTGWKGRQPFSQGCCVEGFASDLGGQFYENSNGPLDIVPADGWFTGVLVFVAEPPTGTALVARNGNVADEGWRITMFDMSGTAGEPAVGFNFSVFDGGGVAAAAITTNPILLRNLDEAGGSVGIALFAIFQPPSLTFPDGGIWHNYSSTTVGLSAPYVNTDPELFVGRENLDVFAPPNCISGLVGGEADWPDANLGRAIATANQWRADIQEANQVVEVTNQHELSLVNQNGWRISGDSTSPFFPAPNPWPDFVGSEDLVYGTAQPPGRNLTTGCTAPLVLYPDNI